MIKAVIFDKDGVITDSLELWFDIVSTTLSNYGISTNRSIFIEECVRKGVSPYEAFDVSSRGISLDGYREDKKDIYLKIIDKRLKLMPGARGCIRKLYNDFRLCVASSNHLYIVKHELKISGLEGYFEFAISGDDVPRNKPYPDIYLKVSKTLGLKPSECAVIEDSESGIKAGLSAGMNCIAVPNKWTKEQDFSGAIFIIEGLEHLNKNMIEAI